MFKKSLNDLSIPKSSLLESFRIRFNKHSEKVIEKLFENSHLRFYSHARWGIADFALLHKTSLVFLPEFICRDIIEPLNEINVKIQYYKTNIDLSPDWTSVPSNTSDKAHLFVLVHYFGFVNNLKMAKSECKKRELILLNDCAHIFPFFNSIINSISIDAVYSIRKFLPMPDGAILRLNTNNKFSNDNIKLFKFSNKSFLQWLIRNFLTIRHKQKLKNLIKIKDKEIQENSYVKPVRISTYSLRAINYSINHSETYVAIRRKNYELYLEHFKGLKGLTIIYSEITNNDCPYLFPLLLPKNKSKIYRTLKNKIPISTWPKLPNEVLEKGISDKQNIINRQLITLPVHQYLMKYDIEKIAQQFVHEYKLTQ